MDEPHLFDEQFYLDAEFKNITFSERNLSEKEFYNCRFNSCNFFKTKFVSCEFEKCTFNACDMSLISIVNTKLLDVTFQGSKTVGVDWHGVIQPSSYGFIDSKIDGGNFLKLHLQSVVMKNCSVINADFSMANLSKGNFSGSDFTGSTFAGTDLSFADFSDAVNYNINPDRNKLKKTIFSMPEVVSLLNNYDIIIK